MMQQAIDLYNTSPKIGIKVPPPLNGSLLDLDFIPTDRHQQPMSTRKSGLSTKNPKLKALISPLNIPSSNDPLSSTLEHFSSRKMIHDKSPVEAKPRVRHFKRRNINVERGATPNSFISTKRETGHWIPPISPQADLQGWSIGKMDNADSIDELSQEMEMRTPSVDLYDDS